MEFTDAFDLQEKNFVFFTSDYFRMAQIPPRKGGVHPIYGVFIGGGELDENYCLTGTRHYKFTTQRRGAKVVNAIEQALLKAIESKDSVNLMGA